MLNKTSENSRGPISWMVHNRVTPNLLMIFLILGGLYMSTKIKKEVFPSFELDMVSISVSYPGSSPEEVEQGIVLAIEDAIEGIDGIKEVTSTAGEGNGSVRAELMDDANPQMVLQDIQQEVGRISTFPDDAEDAVISLASHKRQVLRVNFFGDVQERSLREVVEQVRDRLLQASDITQVEISGARDLEVVVEIPMEKLRMHGLTLSAVANIIRQSSVEIPGGKLDTSGGEILLRIDNRKDWANEFARIPVVTTTNGTTLYLEDIADVHEGFESSNSEASYERQRSLTLRVYRVGTQTPIGVSDATKEAMAEIEADLPPGIDWKITSDRSDIYKQRLELLLKNALIGLVLVLVLLGLFLELKLAFWVTMGIPISFLGGLLFLPMFGVSINMISMFAFIVSLGIVVDDAIIAGENIYEYRQRGLHFVDAAIEGAKDVAVPIAFSILTNIVAFMPLLFVPGTMGKVWKVIPLVVITVFLISWIESLLILPAHLAHSSTRSPNRILKFFARYQQAFGRSFTWFVENVYGSFLDKVLHLKFLTVAVLIAILAVTFSYVASGRISMILMPRVESDRAVVTATLPYGSPYTKLAAVRDQIVSAMERVRDEHGDKDLVEGISSLINGDKIEVYAYLTSPEVRPLSTRDVTKLWRQEVGPIVGVQSSLFESDRGGPGSGASLSVELSHRDIDILDQASAELARQLEDFPSVKDIDDGYTPGKPQFNFTINERGHSLGLSATDVGKQVRDSFQGTIALRQQRGANEVSVRVRLPEEQRVSEYDIESMLIATTAGTFVPLSDIAEVERGRAYTSITRRDGRRTVMVEANVDPIGESSQIIAKLNSTVLPALANTFPGITYGYKGRQSSRVESVQSLFQGFIFSLISIYFLLAIPFRSYSQPIIVMIAIPFGMVGAVLGHLLMGYNLSLMSMMGVVALSGIVVNDSLVLVDYANKRRREGFSPLDAIRAAALRRYRPVILTTLTTFCGLAPMIFETSRQARFMIPMALSLGFGILFATIITLILVPCLYLIIENIREFLREAIGGVTVNPEIS
ncbi:efflux RND transporter permease subunit [Desulfosediminicola flagellatus]|uniref:efflux RND transporter permease subunit n=1 Tax=Desulfosediminicola flagellatus TaxID=2569541 RepID=UPI001E616526|nr:efflux RND transporter permease subunit [Desulfosediminicola flagellatus]